MLQIRKNDFDSEMVDIFTEKGSILWGTIHTDMIQHTNPDNWVLISAMLDEGDTIQIKLADEDGELIK